MNCSAWKRVKRHPYLFIFLLPSVTKMGPNISVPQYEIMAPRKVFLMISQPCWHIFSLRYQQMAGCFSSWLKFGLSLPLTLRSASYSRSGSNWWILLVLGTQFLVLTASIAFEKCLTWHIFVSVFCNVEIFWHGSSSLLFSILQYYCLFCLIIFISFCLYGIIMTTIFSFFKPHILCSME